MLCLEASLKYYLFPLVYWGRTLTTRKSYILTTEMSAVCVLGEGGQWVLGHFVSQSCCMD